MRRTEIPSHGDKAFKDIRFEKNVCVQHEAVITRKKKRIYVHFFDVGKVDDQVRKPYEDLFKIPQITLKILLLRQMLVDLCLAHHASRQSLVKGRESYRIILYRLEDYPAGSKN